MNDFNSPGRYWYHKGSFFGNVCYIEGNPKTDRMKHAGK